jgi:hypothetical protein
MPLSRPLSVVLPERLRQMVPSFAWIDRRLRQYGFLSSMTSDELGLYVFLALAADRDGLSCWRLDRMERELPSDIGPLARARAGLVDKDLIAFAPWSRRSSDGTYQLLSIEPRDTTPARRGGVASLGDTLLQMR